MVRSSGHEKSTPDSMFIQVKQRPSKPVSADQGAGGGSLAGYEYQIDVSVWLALDLLLGSKQARQLTLEPATQEDLEAELEEFEPGIVTGAAPVAGYKLVVQAKLRTGDAWTVANINALLRHGKRRTSARDRLKDPNVRYLLVTSAALNGGTKHLQIAQAGVWPKASKMPAAIKNILPTDAPGRVAIIGNKDEQRLKNDIRDLLRENFRVPNARWLACWKRLREDARARISGAGSGLWKREDIEDVIKKHEGYIASSPELSLYVYPNNWDELRRSIREHHAALIIGQSGTGKTLATQKLYEELSEEIPGLSRVPITRGPAELNADNTSRPVFYDIEDPWGRFDFEPGSRPWNDQLSQAFSKAAHDRITVATTRLDVGQQSGALGTVERWRVSLESENYGDSERAQLYRSRIDALPRDLQATAKSAEAQVLKELSTPLEIQKFFDALPTLDRKDLRNPEHFITTAIGRAHQNSIEQTVVDQIEQRDGGVRAAAVVWGLLKATSKLSLPVLRAVEETLSDHEPQMIAEASSLVAFFVAARNLRQSEDLITYYHPRVESGIERALLRSDLKTRKMLGLLIDVLTSPDGPGEDWGAGAAARLIAAVKESGKFSVSLKKAAATKIDEWLVTKLAELGSGLEANLKLAAAAGSPSSVEAELARYLSHDSARGLGWGFNHWDRPEKDDAWYVTMRESQTVSALLERFVREILPTTHMHYPNSLAGDLKRVAPNLSAAFLDAASRTVSWGYFSSDDAIAEGALDDLVGFEKVVDEAFESLIVSEEDHKKQEEQWLALVNGEYSDHYAEHLSNSNDDGHTARTYLEAYVDRVRTTVGWKHIVKHRHLDGLREYWLRSIQKAPAGTSLAPGEMADAFACSLGSQDEDDLWYALLRFWDDRYLPTVEDRLGTGGAPLKTYVAAVACLVSHAPEQLQELVQRLSSNGKQERLLEITAAMAQLRDRRAPLGDKLQEAAAACTADLPDPWPEICDAFLDLQNRRSPKLGESARIVLSKAENPTSEMRRLRLVAEACSGEQALADVRVLLESRDDDIAAEGMKAAAREQMTSIVEEGLTHRFAAVRAIALETLGKTAPTPLPQALLSFVSDRGFPVKKAFVGLLTEKPHSAHEPLLLQLTHDKVSDLSHYMGGPDSYPIARAAVEGLSTYESLSTETIDDLYESSVGSDDPDLRRSAFGIVASRGNAAQQAKLMKLVITPSKLSVRQSAAWALLIAHEYLMPEVTAQITPELLLSRVESIAVLLTLIYAANAGLQSVRTAAEQLAASSKRRVLLLLVIHRLVERDQALAQQIARMLPSNHPALAWAFGEQMESVQDGLVSDLGDPGICAEVLFFMRPVKEETANA